VKRKEATRQVRWRKKGKTRALLLRGQLYLARSFATPLPPSSPPVLAVVWGIGGTAVGPRGVPRSSSWILPRFDSQKFNRPARKIEITTGLSRHMFFHCHVTQIKKCRVKTKHCRVYRDAPVSPRGCGKCLLYQAPNSKQKEPL